MIDGPYHNFDDLPAWVTKVVRQMRPKDAEAWVFRSVPALNNRSLLDWMNAGEDGRERVRKYLADVTGRFLS
jgi:hypothetical protein